LSKKEIKIKGIPASSGIAIGKIFLLDSEEFAITKKKLVDKDIPSEIARFEDALIQTRSEILAIQDKISKQMGSKHGEIFNAHLLVLEDRMLIEEVISSLRRDKVCVEYIFQRVLEKYAKTFSEINDEYLRERVADIDDVSKRILRNLLAKERETFENLKEPVVIIAYNLSPSETASMHHKSVIGFATDIGGRTSHTAIMAKSLEIPAVVGLEHVTVEARKGDIAIVDGTHGTVIINPTPTTVKRYKKYKEEYEESGRILLNMKDLPSVTKDGKKIVISANIELPEDIPSVLSHGADGIGLYRTEYFYLNKKGLPTEEEHYQAYKHVAEQMAPHSVIIRTLDLGGDKFLSQLNTPHEMNPFMGWRAIRFCLARPDIFKVQLRAILRASAHGNIKMMYPMISGIEELRGANEMLDEVRAELTAKKIKFDRDMEVGAMIEIPSAAMTSDILAEEADFFSIGTNDLIQYALAVDRINEKIAYLYQPAHPAVLRLIKNVIDNGKKAGIWVGMCGEMAGDPPLALLLLGLGLDEFSMSPIVVPKVKKIIRSVTMKQVNEIAENALHLKTAKDVMDYTHKKIYEILPNLVL